MTDKTNIEKEAIKEFEDRFVADNILDCIPEKNWKEMKGEVNSFIQKKVDKALSRQKEKIVEMINDLPRIEIIHKDGSKTKAVLEHSLDIITKLKAK